MNVRELFLTFVVAFVIFRVFRSNVRVDHYHHYKKSKDDGKVKIVKEKGKLDDGEFTDYEEVD